MGTTTTEQGLGGQSATTTGVGYFSQSDQWTVAAEPRKEYAFENPTGAAEVSFAGQVAFGRVAFTILDADGAPVWGYETLGPSQVSESGATSRGEPGTWRIVREALASSGQVAMTITSA